MSFLAIEFDAAEKPNTGLNLFLWCILFNKIEIAKIFLQHGEVIRFLVYLIDFQL